ncbi:MAG: hypothetical protein KKB50_17110 [Planctomycetes bacterium]|nr:hypothetical protein [Planctomycetota bacterium]
METAGFAYHSNLLEFTAAAGLFGLLQHEYEETAPGFSAGGHDDGAVLEFDLTGRFLQKKKYPGSVIRCTDCHNNDDGPRAGGGGPDGPHGSNYDFLLERNYAVRDGAVESAFEYALCYKCHQQSSILSDRSFPFHSAHVVDQCTPCSACHDPHGINRTQGFGSDHTHLINFNTQIVRPDPTTRRMAFQDRGARSGSCTLTCHGSAHRDRAYNARGAE